MAGPDLVLVAWERLQIELEALTALIAVGSDEFRDTKKPRPSRS